MRSVYIHINIQYTALICSKDHIASASNGFIFLFHRHNFEHQANHYHISLVTTTSLGNLVAKMWSSMPHVFICNMISIYPTINLQMEYMHVIYGHIRHIVRFEGLIIIVSVHLHEMVLLFFACGFLVCEKSGWSQTTEVNTAQNNDSALQRPASVVDSEIEQWISIR